MSASLVGSEMCIRDRRGPSPPGPPSRAALAASPSPRRRKDPQKLLEGRPVSYTHLTLPTICSV
eukprot:9803186-Alexandrium_andersonii.AAC.1